MAIRARADLAGAYLAGANLADADLAGAYLAGAYLAGANLADAYLAGANLADADLAGAYLARADLTGANLTGADLTRANLAGADLTRADLTRANLTRANLAGADLTRANLTGADLADANLAGADLTRANLAGADLAGATESPPEEIPVIPSIDAAILAAIEAGGILEMSSWHGAGGVCGTTHCRAGWAVHLAGEKGKELEARVGPRIAGSMIYRASRPGQHAPWFFAPKDQAMDDIRKCAAEQTSDPERGTDGSSRDMIRKTSRACDLRGVAVFAHDDG